MAQQIKFSAFSKQQQTRGVLVEVQVARSLDIQFSVLLDHLISPLATFPRTASPSPATALLLVASSDYGLFFTPGFHRLGGFCRSHQSWRRPNDTQSATSNCSTHDR
jgi:hypothetical protein